MADPYDRWRENLRANAAGERFVISTTPDPGLYKRKFHKGGPWIPVWVYPKPENGEPWLALRTFADGKTEEVDAVDEWIKILGRAITQEEYDQVAEQGGEWFGTDPIVGQQVRDASGRNEPGDEAEILKDQITHAMMGVEQYAKLTGWRTRGKTRIPVVQSFIKDDDSFAKAQTMRARLNELHKEGEELFHKEKDPITKEGKRVDERWRFRADAEDAALIIRSAMEEYQTAQLEAARKAEEEHRKSVEAAQKAAAEAEDDISFTNPPAPVEPPPPPPAALQSTVKGSYGRAASLGQAWDVVRITDQDALYRYMHEHDDLKKLLLDLAQRATNKGLDVPGIEKKIRATVS